MSSPHQKQPAGLTAELGSMDRHFTISIPWQEIAAVGGTAKVGVTIRNTVSNQTYSFSSLEDAYIYEQPFASSKDCEDNILSSAEVASTENGASDLAYCTQDIVMYRHHGQLYMQGLFDEAGVIELILSAEGNIADTVYEHRLVPDTHISNLITTIDSILSNRWSLEGAYPQEFAARGLTVKSFAPVWNRLSKFYAHGSRPDREYQDVEALTILLGGRGFCEGVWMGVQSDLPTIPEFAKMIANSAEVAKYLYEGFKVLVNLTPDKWNDLAATLIKPFVQIGDKYVENWTAPTGVEVAPYLAGFTCGYITEQLAATYIIGGRLRAGSIAMHAGKYIQAARDGISTPLADMGIIEIGQAMRGKISLFRATSSDALDIGDVRTLQQLADGLQITRPGFVPDPVPPKAEVSQSSVPEAPNVLAPSAPAYPDHTPFSRDAIRRILWDGDYIAPDRLGPKRLIHRGVEVGPLMSLYMEALPAKPAWKQSIEGSYTRSFFENLRPLTSKYHAMWFYARDAESVMTVLEWTRPMRNDHSDYATLYVFEGMPQIQGGPQRLAMMFSDGKGMILFDRSENFEVAYYGQAERWREVAECLGVNPEAYEVQEGQQRMVDPVEPANEYEGSLYDFDGFYPHTIGPKVTMYERFYNKDMFSMLIDGVIPNMSGDKHISSSESFMAGVDAFINYYGGTILQICGHDDACYVLENYWPARPGTFSYTLRRLQENPAEQGGTTYVALLSTDKSAAIVVTDGITESWEAGKGRGFEIAFYGTPARWEEVCPLFGR